MTGNSSGLSRLAGLRVLGCGAGIPCTPCTTSDPLTQSRGFCSVSISITYPIGLWSCDCSPAMQGWLTNSGEPPARTPPPNSPVGGFLRRDGTMYSTGVLIDTNIPEPGSRCRPVIPQPSTIDPTVLHLHSCASAPCLSPLSPTPQPSSSNINLRVTTPLGSPIHELHKL